MPPGEDAYLLRRIWLTDAEEQGYYYGFANEGMWPLCHVAHVRPVFRESDWQHYRAINQRFADAVVREARSDNPVILPDRWIADFEKIAIKPDVRPLVMRENAVRLLKLRAPSSPPKPS